MLRSSPESFEAIRRHSFDVDVSLKRLDIIRKKYRNGGWNFDVATRSAGGGRYRKLSEAGIEAVKKLRKAQMPENLPKR